jgi:hypothetical protein
MEKGKGKTEQGDGKRPAGAPPTAQPRRFRRGSSFSRFPFPLSILLAATFITALLTSACGYRVAGRGSALPSEWRTLAVVSLENRTSRYRIEQRLTGAVVRELMARTRYRIVHQAEGADAAITGEVLSIETSPVLFDASTGRPTALVVTVRLRAALADHTGRVVWRNDDYLFRAQYELSSDVASFFDESEPALERLARDFAAALVSAILEDF